MQRKTICQWVGTCLVAATSHALGAVSYSYVTDLPSYDVSTGSASVKIYLKETLTGGSASLLGADAENGLFGAGFKASRTAGADVTITGFDPNTSLFGGSVILGPTPATIFKASVSTDILDASGPMPDGDGKTLLGTLNLGWAGTDSGAATFALERYDDSGFNTLSFTNGYDLDFNSADPAFNGATGITTFMTAVPEPASLGLLIGSCFLLARRRR